MERIDLIFNSFGNIRYGRRRVMMTIQTLDDVTDFSCRDSLLVQRDDSGLEVVCSARIFGYQLLLKVSIAIARN